MDLSIPNLKMDRKLLNEITENKFNEMPSKRLVCNCGVSFVAEETLNGHKKYYCKNRNNYDEDQEIQHSNNVKKVSLKK